MNLHVHKPGAFKQQNKTHKHGKHKTKGQLEKEAKGRVSVKVLTKKSKQNLKKADRKNKSVQIRKQKRDEVLAKKRSRGEVGSPPHFVGIIPLCEGLDTQDALDLLKEADGESYTTVNDMGITHMSIPRFKQRVAFFSPEYGNLDALLDTVKMADSLVLLLSPEMGIDQYGEYCLSCLFAQGLPACTLTVMGLHAMSRKKQTDAKKMLQKITENRFPKDRCHSLDSKQDALVVLRQICCQKLQPISLREYRPHLMGEALNFELNDTQSSEGTLKISGYIRGQALDVNGLVHIPGLGDYQMSQIDSVQDPYPLRRKDDENKNKDSEMIDEEAVKVLDVAHFDKQQSLQSEVIPDPMDGEQTWPTEEELHEAEACQKSKKEFKKVPRGTSDYQAAWIIDDEQEVEDCEEEGDMDCLEEQSNDSEDAVSVAETEEMDTMTVTFGDTETYDAAIDIDEERAMLEKYKAARLDQMFPDEVDTPVDVPARKRFTRYRGLKSFRTSPWDPKENLPSDYARIFQFENFNRTRRRVLKEDREAGAMPGWYVTVHVKNVPSSFIESYKPGCPVILYGLLPHEQKMSVVHLVLKRHPSNTEPIRSKERLIFHVGYRRFTACPVFSQHTNADKHKFERYLRSDVTVATMYAPIMFSPASVLVFKEHDNGEQDLIATGSLLSVNPNRVITKRVILSGHPFKINRKHAVVRYMFFNRDDIEWFKPVELRTKFGRRGHIKEPLGTHGHMKCTFDGQLKSMDSVLINLYKRVYPKWTYDSHITQTAVRTTTAEQTDGLKDEEIAALF